MGRPFPHSAHLVRMGVLLFAGLLAFVAARRMLVPPGFGRFGHYRPGALDDNRARSPVHAGKAACIACHTDVEDLRQGTPHAALSCEVCHGPQALHADDPAKAKPPRPKAPGLCLGCHQTLLARPKAFKQVDPKEHAGDACLDCHSPHAPGKEEKR